MDSKPKKINSFLRQIRVGFIGTISGCLLVIIISVVWFAIFSTDYEWSIIIFLVLFALFLIFWPAMMVYKFDATLWGLIAGFFPTVIILVLTTIGSDMIFPDNRLLQIMINFCFVVLFGPKWMVPCMTCLALIGWIIGRVLGLPPKQKS